MKHTPGPWRVSQKNRVQVCDKSGQQIAAVWMMRNGEGLANADLLAAAPELHQELATLVRLLEPALENGVHIPGLATLNAAKAALAKAESLPA